MPIYHLGDSSLALLNVLSVAADLLHYVRVDYIRIDSAAYWSMWTVAFYDRGLAVAHLA
jgi:hypothetical protein